jgi:hypothetical protein
LLKCKKFSKNYYIFKLDIDEQSDVNGPLYVRHTCKKGVSLLKIFLKKLNKNTNDYKVTYNEIW